MIDTASVLSRSGCRSHMWQMDLLFIHGVGYFTAVNISFMHSDTHSMPTWTCQAQVVPQVVPSRRLQHALGVCYACCVLCRAHGHLLRRCHLQSACAVPGPRMLGYSQILCIRLMQKLLDVEAACRRCPWPIPGVCMDSQHGINESTQGVQRALHVRNVWSSRHGHTH